MQVVAYGMQRYEKSIYSSFLPIFVSSIKRQMASTGGKVPSMRDAWSFFQLSQASSGAFPTMTLFAKMCFVLPCNSASAEQAFATREQVLNKTTSQSTLELVDGKIRIMLHTPPCDTIESIVTVKKELIPMCENTFRERHQSRGAFVLRSAQGPRARAAAASSTGGAPSQVTAGVIVFARPLQRP